MLLVGPAIEICNLNPRGLARYRHALDQGRGLPHLGYVCWYQILDVRWRTSA